MVGASDDWGDGWDIEDRTLWKPSISLQLKSPRPGEIGTHNSMKVAFWRNMLWNSPAPCARQRIEELGPQSDVFSVASSYFIYLFFYFSLWKIKRGPMKQRADWKEEPKVIRIVSWKINLNDQRSVSWKKENTQRTSETEQWSCQGVTQLLPRHICISIVEAKERGHWIDPYLRR